MVWARWTESVAAALTCAGLAIGQETAVPETPAGGQVVTVQEFGSGPQQCRVQKMWRQPDGTMAYEVQALDTGERLTIVESNREPTTGEGGVQGKLTRIFRWGRRMTAPPGTPEPAADTVVVSPSAETVVETPVREPAPTEAVSVEPPVAAPAPTPAAEHPVAAAAVVHAAAPAPVAARPPEQPAPLPAAPTAAAKPTPAPKVVQAPAPAPVVVQTPTPAATPVAPAPVASPVKAPVRPAVAARPAVAPAPCSDWHESWGKVDDHHSEVPLVNLPRADTSKPDPLHDLPRFVQMPTENRLADRPDASLVKLKHKAPEPAALAADYAPLDPTPSAEPPAPVSPPAAGLTPVVINGPATPPAPVPIAAPAPAPAPAVVAPPTAPEPAVAATAAPAVGPTGVGVFRPLQMAPGARAVVLPKDEPPGNAFADFEPAKQAGGKAAVTLPTNAFSGQQRPGQPVSPYGPAGMNPAVMMQLAAQRRAYGLSPYGAAYAGAGMVPAGGSYGPMAPPVVPGQYAVWHTNAPAAAAEPARPATLPESVTPTTADGLLATLHDALLPSEREAAAEALAAPDKATDPGVVTAVARAAREDPAPCVRATCVRCLVKMQADSDVVKTTLRALQGDTEAEVRQEAEQALAHLATPAGAGGPVQPVGHFTSDGTK